MMVGDVDLNSGKDLGTCPLTAVWTLNGTTLGKTTFTMDGVAEVLGVPVTELAKERYFSDAEREQLAVRLIHAALNLAGWREDGENAEVTETGNDADAASGAGGNGG